MIEQLHDFVNQRLPLPGLLAWGAGLPDGTFESNGYQDGFQSLQIQPFLKRIDQISRTLSPIGSDGVRFCWTFQLVRIYAVSSLQGASLLLCFRNEQRLPSEAMSNVFTAFEKLNWTDLPSPSTSERL